MFDSLQNLFWLFKLIGGNYDGFSSILFKHLHHHGYRALCLWLFLYCQPRVIPSHCWSKFSNELQRWANIFAHRPIMQSNLFNIGQFYLCGKGGRQFLWRHYFQLRKPLCSTNDYFLHLYPLTIYYNPDYL